MSGGPLALSVHAKQALVVVTAVSLVLGGTGALAVLSYEPPPEAEYEPYEPAEHVPAGVDYFGTLDLDTYRQSPAARNATRFSLRFQEIVQFYDGPPYPRALALSPPPNGSLNLSAASHVTYYGRHGSNYDARLVVGNWTARAAADAMAARLNVSYERTTVDNRTLYESPAGSAVGVVDAGGRGGPVPERGRRLLAIGNATAVRDALAVRVERGGDPDTVGGELLRRYRDTGEGYVRYAFAFRPDTVPDYRFVGPAVNTIRWVGTSYRLNRSGTPTTAGGTPAGTAPNVTVRIRITAEEADAADDVRNIMNLGVGVYQIRTENRTMKQELRRVNIGVEGRTITIDHTTTPRRLRILVRGLIRNQPEPQGSLAPPARQRQDTAAPDRPRRVRRAGGVATGEVGA